MIIFYSSEIPERLKYIVEFIFCDILKTEISFTSDKDYLDRQEGAKIVYGKEKIKDHFFILSANLLFEKDIQLQERELSKWDNLPVFFQVTGGELPFDIFAASFYLVSRYSEYLPHATDRHHRYRPEDSLPFKGGFLERPIVNLWAHKLKDLLLQKYPQLQFRKTIFSFTPTIDIDNAYAFKHKGMIKNSLALANHLVRLEFGRFSKRLKVLFNVTKDPYDTYLEQEELHKKYNLHPLYFILIGDKGKFDRNLSYKNPQMVTLLKELSKSATICLHPSYASQDNPQVILKEKERLEKIIGKKIEKSRQHYIRMNMPDTYRALISIGIKEDYSMGYGTKTGFRAGTCTPFYFFDVLKNEKTDLKVHPFVMMDSTLKTHMKLRSKEVLPYMKPIIDDIRSVGGNFTFIFHNESMGGKGIWSNWGNMYHNIIKMAMDLK